MISTDLTSRRTAMVTEQSTPASGLLTLVEAKQAFTWTSRDRVRAQESGFPAGPIGHAISMLGWYGVRQQVLDVKHRPAAEVFDLEALTLPDAIECSRGRVSRQDVA